ncbi:hypothetical protein OJAV_G00165830 [Oryzias javanicus]|uniref:Rapunzel 4 n=1 Tax=Oryzias javanicus TaxID=123683 RepID=A0A437CKG4_ORYJA|nr:hypothetical protein OJAV_G00165830 [Oryzias javanicus]
MTVVILGVELLNPEEVVVCTLEKSTRMAVSDVENVADKVLDVYQKGANIVTLFQQGFSAIFSAVGPLSDQSLNKEEDAVKDGAVNDQFGKFFKNLDGISDDTMRIREIVTKSMADLDYSLFENNIRMQHRMYLEILDARPEFREVKRDQFLKHFSSSDGEKNIERLYSAVVEGYSSKPLLEIVLDYEDKTQRSVEEFCAQLLNLFCIGIIAVLGHAAMSENGNEKRLLKEWEEKMVTIQEKMKAAIEECIASFPSQAKTYCERLVGQVKESKQLADALVEMLKKKYGWVGWSVRVYRNRKRHKTADSLKGKNSFKVTGTDEKMNIWVSYSDSPKSLDKKLIQHLILNHKKPIAEEVEKDLSEKLGDCMVHTLQNYKNFACSWSFTDDCHFWEKHEDLHVCVHCA